MISSAEMMRNCVAYFESKAANPEGYAAAVKKEKRRRHFLADEYPQFRRMRPVPAELCERVCALRAIGKSLAAIANEVAVGVGTVRRALHESGIATS